MNRRPRTRDSERVFARDPLAWMSVRHKLALGLVAVCLLAFGVGGYLVSSSARATLEEEILRRLEIQCRAYASVLDASLGLLKRRTEDFASDGYLRDGMEAFGGMPAPRDRERIRDDLHRHLEVNKLSLVPEFTDLALLSPEGTVLTSVRGLIQAGETDASAERRMTEETECSGFLGVDPGDPPTFLIATPIRSLHGSQEIGRLLVRVHVGVWMALSLPRTPSASAEDLFATVCLVDRSSRTLKVGSEFLRHAGGGSTELVRSGFGLRLVDAVPGRVEPGPGPSSSRGVLSRDLPLASTGWRLQLSLSADHIMNPVMGLQSRFLIVGLTLASLAGILCYFPMRFIAQPLVLLRDAAQRIRQCDFSARVPVDSQDEIGDLARSFNQMAAGLAERTERLERTAADLQDRSRDLKKERDRLEGVIRCMRDGLAVLDASGQVVLANEAARPLLGLLREAPARLSGHHLCRDHGEHSGDCRACLMDSRAPLRSCLVDVGNQVYEIHVTGLMPDETGRQGRVLLCRDITDRIGQDERQIHQERLAVLGEVAAVMAHELNNPLAAISMFSQLLANEIPGDSPHRESVEVIQRNTLTCKKTIRELLNYATGACPEVGPVDLHATLMDVARFLEPLSRRARIAIDWDLESGSPEISGDEIQIRQIFVNLVMNALQAVGPEGGRVRIATRLEAEHLAVRVEDSGPGIDVDDQKKIFRPFFTTKPRGEGTGLGLPTARRLAEMHGGSIELVESAKGRTVFRVRLKRRLPQLAAKEGMTWSL